MEINIKRFVDIDVDYHVVSSTSSIRDTVVLMTTEGILNNHKIFNSLIEFYNDDTYKNYSTTAKYLDIFFRNGGIKVDVRCGISNASAIVSEIEKLSNDKIVIAFTGSFDFIKEAATIMTSKQGTVGNITKVYGINQKILLGRSTTASDCKSINNFAVKVSDIPGAEMTMAAYLSKLNIYGIDTIRDYTFTIENFSTDQLVLIKNEDELLGQVLDNNMNIDMELSAAIRNLGGNLTNGKDLVNQYTLIILQQTVTNRLINLLTQKIKGQTAISAIYTTIASELSKYVTNGYLATDKIWTDSTKTISYNNKTYTLIEKGAALTLGYKISILPFDSLSDDDKVKRKCPPIYIFLADSYGIRNITINGEVI